MTTEFGMIGQVYVALETHGVDVQKGNEAAKLIMDLFRKVVITPEEVAVIGALGLFGAFIGSISGITEFGNRQITVAQARANQFRTTRNCAIGGVLIGIAGALAEN